MNKLIDMEKAIDCLQEKRKVFVSEADMQLELAWILKDLYPNAAVRCEYVPRFDSSMHIDILVVYNEAWIPIELKYKTKGCEKSIDGTLYTLKNHSAKDIGCYLYLKDVQRIEKIKEHIGKDFAVGYTLFVTNETAYMKKPQRDSCFYKAFSLEDGINKTGVLDWAEGTGAGTKKGHETPINLSGNYICRWRNYSKLDDTSTGTFIYLLNEVV